MTKLSAMPYAQAHVEETRFGTRLVSYSTVVAEISNGDLYVYGLYSMTTRKHISAYLKEYANLPYSVAKECVKLKAHYHIGLKRFYDEEGNFIKQGE